MHPEIAKTLVEQRRQELTRYRAESGQGLTRYSAESGQELTRYSAESGQETTDSAGPSWLSRLPRWRISWSRTRLSPAGGPAVVGPDRTGKRGSSLVIIISAYRSA